MFNGKGFTFSLNEMCIVNRRRFVFFIQVKSDEMKFNKKANHFLGSMFCRFKCKRTSMGRFYLLRDMNLRDRPEDAVASGEKCLMLFK